MARPNRSIRSCGLPGAENLPSTSLLTDGGSSSTTTLWVPLLRSRRRGRRLLRIRRHGCGRARRAQCCRNRRGAVPGIVVAVEFRTRAPGEPGRLAGGPICSPMAKTRALGHIGGLARRPRYRRCGGHRFRGTSFCRRLTRRRCIGRSRCSCRQERLAPGVLPQRQAFRRGRTPAPPRPRFRRHPQPSGALALGRRAHPQRTVASQRRGDTRDDAGGVHRP